MKLLLAACLVVVAVGGPTTAPDCIPDQCGPKKMVPQFKYTGPSTDTSLSCEICLDAVLIAETYAECDESKLKDLLECDCDKKYGGGSALDRACRASVDKIAHEVITDTNADPSAVCHKVLGTNCSYTLVEAAYNPYDLRL